MKLEAIVLSPINRLSNTGSFRIIGNVSLLTMIGTVTYNITNNFESCRYLITNISGQDVDVLFIDKGGAVDWEQDKRVYFQDFVYDFFYEITNPNATGWQTLDAGFISNHWLLDSSADATVEFSFNGRDTHVVLEAGYTISFDNRERQYIFWKGTATGSVRVYGWR